MSDPLAKKNEDLEVDKPVRENAPVIQPIQHGAKSSVDEVELPTGYLDENKKLHKDARIRELTGEEEDILTSRKMPMHVRLERIMENCVVSIGDYTQKNLNWRTIIKDLVVTDRLYLILQIRILSLGPIFSVKIQCAGCENITNASVDLNDFKITGIPDPYLRIWEGTLPKSGKSYRVKCQTGWEEGKIARQPDSSDLPSLAILGRLLELDGKDKITMAMVKKLSFQDRSHLRKDFSAHEGEINHSIEYECKLCGHENKDLVDIGHPNFFFPSET